MNAAPPASFRPSLEDLSWVLGLALAAAFALAIPALFEVREAFDHISYFAVALPCLTAFAGVAGMLAPSRAWFVAPAMVLGTFGANAATQPGARNLWPLGVAMLVVLHSPAFLLSLAGRWWRLRRRGEG